MFGTIVNAAAIVAGGVLGTLLKKGVSASYEDSLNKALGVAVLVWMILNRHRFGESLLFIGDSLKVAKVVGIQIEREKIKLFTLMGLLSAFAGVLLTLETTTYFAQAGMGYLLIVVAAVPWLPIEQATALDNTADWVPPMWREMDVALAAAPLGNPRTAIVLGRTGGPAFLPAEVVRLGYLAGIVATLVR